MSKGIKDASGVYRLQPAATELIRASLRYERGTLVLQDCLLLPPSLTEYFRFDPRVDAYRAPAWCYPRVVSALRPLLAANRAPRYRRLTLKSTLTMTPYPHQRDALKEWQQAAGRGLVALPTGAGKTLVGLLALGWAKRDALIVVPTLDLMQQWYALLRASFPEQEIGLLGGGYYELTALTVSTYDSAARHIDHLGNRFGMLICDEAHHLPAEFYRSIAECSLAPFRLGLTATPERADGTHSEFATLLGPIVYRRQPEQLAGDILAPFQIKTVRVELSEQEKTEYHQALAERDSFLRQHRLRLGSLENWQRFVMLSARSPDGRRAMQAHQTARRIAHATPGKLRALGAILASHRGEKSVVFTEDNATAYEASERFLLPCITHQTRIKERQEILDGFRDGKYRAIVTSRVLNEGIDVPDAAIGVILSGSGSNREFVQRLGRILRRADAKRAVLYEVIARDTREEQVATRRRQRLDPAEPAPLPLFPDEPIA